MSRIRTSHRANSATTLPGTGPYSWSLVKQGSGSHGPGRVPVHHTSAHRPPRRRPAFRADPGRLEVVDGRPQHFCMTTVLANLGAKYIGDATTALTSHPPQNRWAKPRVHARWPATRPSSCAAFVVLDGTDPADAEPGIAPRLRTPRVRRRPASRDDCSSHTPSGSGQLHHAPQHRLTAPHPEKRARIMPVEQNSDPPYPFKDGMS
jgi:hypothetical protein